MLFPKRYTKLTIAAHTRSSADEINQLEAPPVGTGPGVLIENQNLHLDGTLEELDASHFSTPDRLTAQFG